ncbi:MAG: hypothetical protein IPM98_06680 [Lewinellaceae bacterium]|nr:hypothetical protein [Lewinellaceae bacterium]
MFSKIEKILDRPERGIGAVALGLFFVLLALVVYWPTRHAGFVMDWLGWQYAYDRGGWAGVPGSFGYPGLHPVLHLGNYTLYWLFGANSPVWYGVFAVLHGLNAWLLARLALRLPLQVSAPQRLFIGAASGLLFLLSPYAAEVVVWRVCLHYLLALLFALLAMHRTLDYLSQPGKRTWWQIQVLVLLALFTFEWSLVIPVLLLALVLVWFFAEKTRPPLSLPGRLFAPQVGLWALYFLLNKIKIGDWVGHYGADTHLNIQPKYMMANMLRYVVKQFAFVRNWEHNAKMPLLENLEFGSAFWIGAGLVLLAAAAWLLFFRRLNTRLQWAGAAFAWFFVALLPVSNLYFYALQYSENDRYGYFASGFGWLGLLLLLSFLPKILYRIIVVGLIAVSSWFLLDINRCWAESEKICAGLVNDFRWYDRDEVIILASPDNYLGVFMFRIIGQINGFNEALELRRGKPFEGKMWEAVQFNVVFPSYAVTAEKDSTGLLYKVGFKQDGNWWWRNGIGATNYENDRYTFTMQQWHVEVLLKEKRPNTAIIYPVGDKWIEVE